jgi:transposase
VYANRRRIEGNRGKELLRRRGELVERSFAHCYETGALRKLHLRGHANILKRVLLHTSGFNLGLVMRRRFGIGKPRALQGALARFFRFFYALCDHLASFRHAMTLVLRRSPGELASQSPFLCCSSAGQ